MKSFLSITRNFLKALERVRLKKERERERERERDSIDASYLRQHCKSRKRAEDKQLEKSVSSPVATRSFHSVTEEGPVARNVLSRTEASCCNGGRDSFFSQTDRQTDRQTENENLE